MIDKQLKSLGFVTEFNISREFEKNRNSIQLVPELSGVYIVLADNKIARVRGESNILYIGKGNNLNKRLRQLLRLLLPGNYRVRGSHTARKALMKIIEETDIRLAISYLTCKNNRELESEILQKFVFNHIEAPALNSQRR